MSKTIAERHQELYNIIPDFECKKGCTDCCGPVPFTAWEWGRIKDKRKANGITCPYAVDGQCDIYEKRPLMCRLYGTVENLRCTEGFRPVGLLSKEQAHEILVEYQKLMEVEE